MASDYEKKRPAFHAPAAPENTYLAEPASAWIPAQYEPWSYGGRSEPAPPPGAESNTQQQQPHQPQQSEQSTSAATPPGSQQWLGYYSSQHLQHPHPAQQQGGQAPINQGPPPLPSVPPPQLPPPPEASTSLPSWSAVVSGGTDQRVADGAGFSYPNYYNHQQQNVQESNYGGQDGQVNNGSGPGPNSSVTPSNVTANGQYASFNPAIGDQYGSGNYAGYNYGYPQQQGNDSYSQNMGPPYQNSGAAPYTPVSSFPSTSSYTDSTSYQNTGTYYNAGVYQNTGGYPASGYSGHPNSWSENSFGSYGGYPGYGGYAAPDQNHTVGGSGAVPNANQYQQDYQPQWENYYANMQSNAPASSDNAPGTAPSNTPPPTYASVVAQGSSGVSQSTAANQPPPPGTQPSWQPNTQSFGASSQANTATSKVGNTWDAASMQNSQAEPHRQMLSHQNHFQGLPQQGNMASIQPQPPTSSHFQQGQPPQSSQGQHTQIHQAKLETPMHVFQPPGPHLMKSGPPQWRSGKMQIPTNPRIASNFIGKGNSGLDSSQQKPAYISVGGRGGKLSSDDIADATLQPGMFPSSLKAYVERALARCKDESQKSVCQDIMKEMITAASRDGSLFTKDWDTEPLFPLPNMPSTSTGKEVLQRTNAGISGLKSGSSPNKRMKSRWEPIGDEESDDRHGSRDISKDSLRDRPKGQENSVSPPKWEKLDGSWNRTKSVQQQNSHLSPAKRGRRISKRGRRSMGFNGTASESESEEETEPSGLRGGVILGSLITAETPEEKKRRQSRTKRFNRGKEMHVGLKPVGKFKPGVGGTASARRSTVDQLVRNYGDGNGHAVEDMDWDSLTVKGTCQEIEKRYLRLTSAPDPSTVRPEEILRKALAMVQSTSKGYLFRFEQLKSIRQDLTVQRIRDELTVEVYETHARMALESGDLPEYNQCQTQLKGLYAEGIKGCSNEFAGYSLLFIIFNHGNSRDLLSTMARLSKEARNDEAVKHALAVRAAVSLGNYTAFFKLYRTAPNLSPYLMDKHVEKMRFEAVKCMTRSYRPSLPVSFIARTLGFSGILTLGGDEKEIDGVDECDEWLRLHGAQVNFDATANELVLDTKTSASSLFMPEPDDVVPHGDANLGLNDFFSARS